MTRVYGAKRIKEICGGLLLYDKVTSEIEREKVEVLASYSGLYIIINIDTSSLTGNV